MNNKYLIQSLQLYFA